MPSPINDQLQSLARDVADLVGPYLLRTFYQEGTYLPTYTGGTTPGTTTYLAQEGTYVRIGALVIAWGTLSWNAQTGSGNARVSLPFVVRNATNYAAPVTLRLNGIVYAGDSFQGIAALNTSYFEIEGVSSNSGFTKSAIELGGALIFQVAYLTE